MTLQAAIEAELPFLRAEALARMLSTVTIRRLTGRMGQDENTGRQVPQWTETHLDIPCRIGGANTGSSGTRTESTVGGELQTALRVAHLEHDTANLADGDLIDVTAGEVAGTVWRIVEAEFADQQTARRIPVESVQRPAEWP